MGKRQLLVSVLVFGFASTLFASYFKCINRVDGQTPIENTCSETVAECRYLEILDQNRVRTFKDNCIDWTDPNSQCQSVDNVPGWGRDWSTGCIGSECDPNNWAFEESAAFWLRCNGDLCPG